MRASFGGAVLRFCLVFFMGVVATLVVLAPGKYSIKDILKPEKRQQWPDYQQAANRVEEANDLAWLYAKKAKDYIKKQID